MGCHHHSILLTFGRECVKSGLISTNLLVFWLKRQTSLFPFLALLDGRQSMSALREEPLDPMEWGCYRRGAEKEEEDDKGKEKEEEKEREKEEEEKKKEKEEDKVKEKEKE